MEIGRDIFGWVGLLGVNIIPIIAVGFAYSNTPLDLIHCNIATAVNIYKCLYSYLKKNALKNSTIVVITITPPRNINYKLQVK